MMTRMLATGAMLVVAIAMGSGAYSQTRPATSAAASFYEPEPRPHGEGWYRPNMPGSPRVGAEVERSSTFAPRDER